MVRRTLLTSVALLSASTIALAQAQSSQTDSTTGTATSTSTATSTDTKTDTSTSTATRTDTRTDTYTDPNRGKITSEGSKGDKLEAASEGEALNPTNGP